ncbi:hypothetical protein [Muriicola marianensis]|uniref:DUF998 domain-containing protein n=1 Tax=Muriicola marianensis TaxID=1324801 RepID=A0ABQ1R938_9FLAO|nr:hypothetical protein [Muriicola marianensis]GGD58314.1 hypothetical protein GCM10011361_25830 [Muriicola marianensis]
MIDLNSISKTAKPSGIVLWLPGVGILFFLVLYVMAAITYPGGSAAQPAHTGFDFWNNYLCDLLDEYAINGELNSARYYARASLFVLCSGLILLWIFLPRLFDKKNFGHFLMWITGITALFIIFLMGTQNHDLIVRLAGGFGFAAILSCAWALVKGGYRALGVLGYVCFIVFLINYLIYETGLFIAALPLIQKVTFVLCLSWFSGLNYNLIKKLKPLKKSDFT